MEMSAFIIYLKPCKYRVWVMRWEREASFSKIDEPVLEVNKKLALFLIDKGGGRVQNTFSPWELGLQNLW